MSATRFGFFLFAVWVSGATGWSQSAGLYSASYQVNVNAAGQNIVGDAANEPSLCVDPTDPNRIAVGWRQFDTVTNDFRQAGWAYSTNGGASWTSPGTLTNIFRSDPVLAADAEGRFYYLGVVTSNLSGFSSDLYQSTNGGATWQLLGPALGGDKEWMAIDTTTGPGRGNLYQLWSPWYNYAGSALNTGDPDKIFSRSTDGGRTWMDAISIPQWPYWGTLDVGPNGELYVVGTDGATFWVSRSTNAANRSVTPAFDLTVPVDLGGPMIYGAPGVNPDGLLGQPWIAVDRSGGPTRGNVYLLCSVTNQPGNFADVMFARSTNGGATWSAARRINDDPTNTQAYHWFGTLSVAPDGRIDACWNDTRSNPNHRFSELYFSCSRDGGLTWSPNQAISPPFDHTLGYPVQQKMGDYIGMVSLRGAACIAYTATFNGEEDVYFARVELPITAAIARLGATVRVSWNTIVGRTYCVQYLDDLALPWTAAAELGCLVGDGGVATLDDPSPGARVRRFYRVVEQR